MIKNLVQTFLLSFLFLTVVGFTTIAFSKWASPASLTETRTKIAVIDTGGAIPGYMCKTGSIDLTGTGLQDDYGHGSHILGIIARGINPKTQCLISIKWLDLYSSYRAQTDKYRNEIAIKAFQAALDSGAKYINMSFAGTPVKKEQYLIKKAVKHKVHIVVAAGNDHKDLSIKCDVYPACYNIQNSYFHVVESSDNGSPASYSNYGGPVNEYEDGTNVLVNGVTMTGTSQAAAIFMSKLIKEKAKDAIH